MSGTPLRARGSPGLLLSAASNWMLLAATVASGFILTPLIIQRVGGLSFGIWRLVWSFVGFYGMLNLGSLSAVNRYIAIAVGSGRQEELNRVVSTAAAMLAVTASIVTLLAHLLAGQLAVFFRVEATDREAFVMLVRMIGIATGVGFLGNVSGAVLTAHGRFVGFNLVNLFVEALRFALMLLFTALGFGLRGLAYAALGGALASLLLQVLLCSLLLPQVRLSLAAVRWDTVKALVGFGVFVLITYLGDLLRFQIDSIVIGRFLDLESVGVYGIAAMLVSYMLKLCLGVNNVFAPRLASLYGTGDQGAFRAAVLRYGRTMAYFGFGVSVAALTVSRDFILLWVGLEPAAAVFLALMAGMSADFAGLAGLAALQAVGKHRYYAYNSIAEGAANLLLSLLLVRPLGMVGVALGTTLPILITKLAIQPWYTARALGLPLSGYLVETVLKPLAAALAVYALLRLAGIDGLGQSLPWLAIRGLIALAAFAALGAGLLATSSDGRGLLQDYIGALRQRRPA